MWRHNRKSLLSPAAETPASTPEAVTSSQIHGHTLSFHSGFPSLIFDVNKEHLKCQRVM